MRNFACRKLDMKLVFHLCCLHLVLGYVKFQNGASVTTGISTVTANTTTSDASSTIDTNTTASTTATSTTTTGTTSASITSTTLVSTTTDPPTTTVPPTTTTVPTTFTTDEPLPESPSNVTVTPRNSTAIFVSWKPPSNYPSARYNISANDTFQRTTNNTNYTITDLQGGSMYLISVVACNSQNFCGPPEIRICHTYPNEPDGVVSSPDSSTTVIVMWKEPDGQVDHYTVSYSSSDGNHSSSLNVTTNVTLCNLVSDSEYSISVRSWSYGLSSENETTSNWTLAEAVPELKLVQRESEVDVTWKQPMRHEHVTLYELMLLNSTKGCLQKFNIFCGDVNITSSLFQSNDSDSVIYGMVNCSSVMLTYTITHAFGSSLYSVSIAAVNPGGKSVETEVPHEMPKANNSWIIAVICIALAITVLAVVLILLRYFRQNKYFGKKSPPSDGDGVINQDFEEEPEPVPIKDFIEHVNKHSCDSNYLFACEYLLLGKLSPKKPTKIAALPVNKSKNRYTDILPFDCSRVKLIRDNCESEATGSDYINASFIPGYNSVCEYIAAQGPMKSSVVSFWLMIWQQNVSTVVMVTNLLERGRVKCEQYWPNDMEPASYGDVHVQLKSESAFDSYTVRVLEFWMGSEKRQLLHYQFLTWPDFGVPTDVEQILSFATEVRKSVKGNEPLLIHCSAGVGRTGTYIVVDHLLQMMKKEEFVDLFHVVLKLRQHRPRMIQMESQYIFAHECIMTAIQKDLDSKKSMNADDEDQEGLYVNAVETNEDSVYANAAEINEVSLYANTGELAVL